MNYNESLNAIIEFLKKQEEEFTYMIKGDAIVVTEITKDMYVRTRIYKYQEGVGFQFKDSKIMDLHLA